MSQSAVSSRVDRIPQSVRDGQRWVRLPDVPGPDESALPDLQRQWTELHADGVIVPVGRLTKTGVAPATVAAIRRVSAVARSAGLAVVARIDTGLPPGSSASEAGQEPGHRGPGAARGDVSCINADHFVDDVPRMIAAAASQLSPDLLLDSAWSGSDADTICRCVPCATAFRQATGRALPGLVDWADPDYRAWVRWGRATRAEIWLRNQEVAARAGSAWSGLVSLDRRRRARRLQDMAVEHAGAVLFAADDEQSARAGRFRGQLDDLRFLRGATSDARIVLLVETALRTSRLFRQVLAPQEETRLRLAISLAAGSSPAVELRGASSRDGRAGAAAAAVLGLRGQGGHPVDAAPAAAVALVYSQVSAESWARTHRELLFDAPYRGMMRAVGEARCPYTPIAASAIPERPGPMTVLVLPNVAAMSDEEVARARSFVEAGGTLVATGETSLYDAEGDPRQDYALADVFGASIAGHVPDRLAAITRITPLSRVDPPGPALGVLKGPATDHSYLRCSPGRRATGDAPPALSGPDGAGLRHPVLAGLQETEIVAFGGLLNPLDVSPDRGVPLTFVPPFPNFPIDEVYPREEQTSIPGLIIGGYGGGRVAFMPADIDRRYGIDPVPDHGKILRNLISWALGDFPELTVSGLGSIQVSLHRGNAGRVLHIVNTTGCDNQAGPVSKVTPVGPFVVSMPAPAGRTDAVRLLVSGATVEPWIDLKGGRPRLVFEVPQILDREIAVFV